MYKPINRIGVGNCNYMQHKLPSGNGPYLVAAGVAWPWLLMGSILVYQVRV